eukprot:NP_001308566.1 uncharacterized protein LOC100383773 precursor [Zea mays]
MRLQGKLIKMRSFPHLLLILALLLVLENVRAQPKPLLINCGSGSSADVDGRTWVGDAHPDGGAGFTVTLAGATATRARKPVDEGGGGGDAAYGELYRTARVFNASSAYRFSVAAGSYFLRLHFSRLFSSNLSGDATAKEAVFDVTANGLRLLSRFSVAGEIYWRNSRTNSTSDVAVKEYLLNVTAARPLEVEFAPDAGSFAFVNAMEVVPVPGNSIFGSVNKVGGVGLKGPFSLGESGVETMYRVCVGGGKIERKEDDPRLWRRWDSDERYIFSMNAAHSIRNTSSISYVSRDGADSVPAPLRLYETARVTEETFVVDRKFNVSWRFGVDPGFEYLVRLHFCELEYGSAEQRRFKIYINGKTAAENYDVVAKAGGKNKAFHEDFLDDDDAAPASETDTLWVQLGSESSATSSAASDALLNGMEIFKVSRNGNLGHPTVRIGGVSGGLEDDRRKRSPRWVLVGAAAGVVIFVSVAAAVYLCFYLHRKKNTNTSAANKKTKTKTKDDNLPATTTAPGLRAAGTFGSCRMGRRFSIAEIKAATMDFDESLVIGVGGFGKVYRGETDTGTPVAVKRGHAESQQGAKEFETEIEMLSRLRHRHLVSLIGYCDEQDEMILVYEHMANGTLRSHLYGSESESDHLPALTWRQRLEICIGAARGLHYLHTGLDRGGVIHRDVKTTNILLDGSLRGEGGGLRHLEARPAAGPHPRQHRREGQLRVPGPGVLHEAAADAELRRVLVRRRPAGGPLRPARHQPGPAEGPGQPPPSGLWSGRGGACSRPWSTVGWTEATTWSPSGSWLRSPRSASRMRDGTGLPSVRSCGTSRPLCSCTKRICRAHQPQLLRVIWSPLMARLLATASGAPKRQQKPLV